MAAETSRPCPDSPTSPEVGLILPHFPHIAWSAPDISQVTPLDTEDYWSPLLQ